MAKNRNSCVEIDICMPTWNSEEILEGTLEALHASSEDSDVIVSRLVIVDNKSDDNTLDIAEKKCRQYGWKGQFISFKSSLPEARKKAIELVETEWFLFLDDDVRVSSTYLSDLFAAVAAKVGAVQGRKKTRNEHNSDWVRRRTRRGGTHATLIRRDAIKDIVYPSDLHVLEDEYTRRYIENQNYLWIFNHQARFQHQSMERHPIGWQEGYIGGKYQLSQFHTVVLNILFAALTKRNPLPQISRALGWIYGCTERSILNTRNKIGERVNE